MSTPVIPLPARAFLSVLSARWDEFWDDLRPRLEALLGPVDYESGPIPFNVTGYYIASFMHRMLEACGNDLTRENLMRVAESVKGWQFDTLVPGIRINTSATDHGTIEQMQLMRFDGTRWVLFGDLVEG